MAARLMVGDGDRVFLHGDQDGEPRAPDDLDAGPKTQVWLATSDDPEAIVPGQYFYHQK